MEQTLRLIEHLHGHAGWLAAIALVHPAIVLRGNKRSPWSVGLATALVTVVFGVGCFMYGFYRERLKQGIFQHAPAIGFLFERKEHLAFGVLLMTWVGALAYLGSYRQLAQRAYIAAAAMAVAVATFGTIVASYRTF